MADFGKKTDPLIYLFGAVFIGVLWWATAKDFIRANKQLTDLIKITDTITSVSIKEFRAKYTYYIVEFTLNKTHKKLGIRAGESYHIAQLLQDKIKIGSEITVYYDTNGAIDENENDIDVYQIENKDEIIHSINEEHLDAYQQAFLESVLLLIIIIIAVKAYINHNDES